MKHLQVGKHSSSVQTSIAQTKLPILVFKRIWLKFGSLHAMVSWKVTVKLTLMTEEKWKRLISWCIICLFYETKRYVVSSKIKTHTDFSVSISKKRSVNVSQLQANVIIFQNKNTRLGQRNIRSTYLCFKKVQVKKKQFKHLGNAE